MGWGLRGGDCGGRTVGRGACGEGPRDSQLPARPALAAPLLTPPLCPPPRVRVCRFLQVVRAKMGEELRERGAELHAEQLKLAAADERVAGLGGQLDQVRSQLRSAEAQRDQAWAREKLLEEQRASAEAHARANAEARDSAQQQLQAALARQLELQQSASEKASAAEAAEVTSSLAELTKALARLEAKHEAQAASSSTEAGRLTRGHEEELARLDGLLQAQAQAHAAAIEQLERRAAAESARVAEAGRATAEQHEAALSDVQSRLREAQEARVRLQSETATRKAAADALGERVAMLQDQLASLQLDHEQLRHAGIAERAELEEAARARQEEVEATRLQVIHLNHEAESFRQQLRERDESLARRAERLRQLQALYDHALQDKQRVEEAAWAERQELHDERRALEARVRGEAERARRAEEQLERLRKNEGGLLSRLFNAAGGSPSSQTKEAWAERPAPLPLTDTARIPSGHNERALEEP